MPVFAQVRSLETDNEEGRARPDFNGHLQKQFVFLLMVLSWSCHYHIKLTEQISLI